MEEREVIRPAPARTPTSVALVCLVAIGTVVPAVAGAPGIGIVVAILIVGAAVWRRRTGLRSIGFIAPGSWTRTLLLGLLLGAIIQLASVVLLDPFIERVTGTPLDLTEFDSIRGDVQALLMWLAIVWVLVVFLEEVIFRGFLITELARLFGRSSAATFANVALTAVVFGLAHWYQGPSGVISTGLVGLLLGLIFVRAGFNLWLPIFVHGFIDTVGLTMIYLNADRYLQGL